MSQRRFRRSNAGEASGGKSKQRKRWKSGGEQVATIAPLPTVEALRTCIHPDHLVIADICEGDAMDCNSSQYSVQWCRQCGAYRRNNCGEWSPPGGDI